MPYKVGEDLYPGSVDEKLSCEVAAYAWMQANCPDIRIPHLYGFGTTSDEHVSSPRARLLGPLYNPTLTLPY